MKPSFDDLHPKIVLGVAAHPDDLDFGAAGTLAKFAAEGTDVHFLLLTDGGKGSADHSTRCAELVKTRQAEQRSSLKCIGGKSVIFLNYPDGCLEVTMDLKRDIVKVIRQLRPDVVVTMDPSVLYSAREGTINHPDHRAAGQATLDAVFPLARDHLAFPELFSDGYEPYKVATILLINANEHNFSVDISKTIEAKMRALSCHLSQLPDTANVLSKMRAKGTEAGRNAGFEYGEQFMRIDIDA